MFPIRLLASLLAMCLATLALPALAEGPAQTGPFVEHRVALQISDSTEEKQALVLSVANNVLKAFGPDKVAIEIVAFGPGLDLLAANNPNAMRVSSLVAQGVVFDACLNTIQTRERNSGKPFPLNKQARTVPGGAPQLMLLAEHGYTVLRP